MPIIEIPDPINYISLKSKPKLKESVYNELLDYLDWSSKNRCPITLENNLDIIIESAIQNVFNTDKEWIKNKKNHKPKSTSNTQNQSIKTQSTSTDLSFLQQPINS